MTAVWLAPLAVMVAGALALYLAAGAALEEAERLRAGMRSLRGLRPLYVEARSSTQRLLGTLEQRRNRAA